jgi:hypothetical protein
MHLDAVLVPWKYLIMLTYFLANFQTDDKLQFCSSEPTFCDAFSNLASAYNRKVNLMEATEYCHQALALNPRLVIAIFSC